ncbi:MAG TPA: cell division protein ZapA [Clostridia bacterium]|jgi:cell division protein ZapA|nr:cell division protein ZapA [Clostridia bacterium]HHY06160.1 cell division protein ZapA [Clostridia bacterium]
MKQKERKKEKEKKNKLNVVIYDEEYVIKGSADQEHIKKVAAFVDKRMEQISNTNSFLSTKQLAVLVALNVADEMLRLREDYDELIKILNGMHKSNKK